MDDVRLGDDVVERRTALMSEDSAGMSYYSCNLQPSEQILENKNKNIKILYIFHDSPPSTHILHYVYYPPVKSLDLYHILVFNISTIKN